MRRLVLLILSAGLMAGACSNANPIAPSAVGGGVLDAKADRPANVNGVVSALTGVPADFSFVVEGTPVRGDGDTEFFGESLFEHLANDVRVEVKGVVRTDHVYARRIHVNSRIVSGPSGGEEPPAPPAPPSCAWPTPDGTGTTTSGTPRFGEIYLSAMTGTAPDLVLSGAGRPVYTTASTIVRRNDDLLPFWILRPGLIVEIFGTWTSTRIDAAEVNLSRNTLDVNAEGPASLVIGDYPEVRFVVGTQAFLANEWTKFSGSPCDILVDGATVRLRGVRMTDGVTVLVTYIEALTQ